MRRAEATEVFKALSVPSRMQIFSLLKREGPLPVKEIAGSLGMTAPAVSQHLRVLRTAGLVTSKRQGYWVPYAVDARLSPTAAGC
jgi:DNA-binding transcriptional ArsR family regulator